MKNTVGGAAGTKSPSAEEDLESTSSYYPGCQKDANCSCKICMESFNATIDLRPFSVQKSSLTRVSSTAESVTPVSFGSLSTPTSRSTRIPSPPPPTPTPPPNYPPEIHPASPVSDRPPTSKAAPARPGVILVFLAILFAAEFGGFLTAGVLKPVFSRGSVRRVGEMAWNVKGVDGKLRFLERSLEGPVSNCSLARSRWEINQDGLLLNSHCKLYESLTEEIRIWGWPLQTAGLLLAGVSTRSFTVISGRVTEWSDGKIGYVTRKSNSSWTQPKWGSSAVQLDPDTWILEYRRNPILESPRLVSAAAGVLKRRTSRVIGNMKRDFWVFFSLEKSHYNVYPESNIQVPT